MKLYKNGTQYPDESRGKWYIANSSSEIEQDREEYEAAQIDQAIENKYHNHGKRR